MSAALTVQSVTKTFRPGEPRILDDITLTADAGRITTILGESGCGKTTLLRIVAGLEEPSSGRLLIADRDVTRLAPVDRDVAMVFQTFGLYPAKTVAKNIEFPLKMAKVAPAERRTRAAEVAAIMHIEHLMNRLPAELSGGQRQRVGICRALVRRPRLLLMDEPLSALDPKLRNELRTEIVALQRAIGSTILYVTHDQTEAMTMSDTVVVMRGGRIEQAGPPDKVFARPASTYVAEFLGNMNLNPAPDVERAGGYAETVGIRPEHFGLAGTRPAAEDDFVVSGRLERCELLGADRILHVRAGEILWRARVDADAPIGDEITLVASRDQVHTFDTETGARRAT
ncbi:ABC transporter ATP-binding protein [Naumannella cuiyingiana]|uniref:ABC-type sugar transport system ATPase subunit n=1 Tax=Naumannella cuiyingiana TaxID=1347891 RepID=A0A7Z0D991_9ACTN|nr:ABC transporter ATP-binding protein [Naumannella cuiyingiana]NYI71303.1 ABC-type sugar transport system ATPase subunit [Naumannella cuiyingiana]